MNNGGFIKFKRSLNTLELLKRPKCFVLLALIAQRARRTHELNVQSLGVGEALLGDHAVIGLTEQEYRTAKKVLEKLGIATFRGTSRGTVAKLVDNTIFDINIDAVNDQSNERITDKQRANNGQATTNKNGKKYKNDKNEKKLKEYKISRKNFLKKSAMSSPTYEDIMKYR